MLATLSIQMLCHIFTFKHKLMRSSFQRNTFFFSEFEMIFKGSDATERRGVFYAISDEDHPVTQLMQSPKKVPVATSVLIGLNVQKVYHNSYFTVFYVCIEESN